VASENGLKAVKEAATAIEEALHKLAASGWSAVVDTAATSIYLCPACTSMYEAFLRCLPKQVLGKSNE